MFLHLMHGALILRTVFRRADAERRREWVRWWSEKLLRIAGVEVRVQGIPPGASEVGAMIAANHITWLDIFAISSVRSTRFIAKSEIRDWPLAGWLAENAGTIFIHRERRRDTARINDRVRDALQAGDCVGLFPEGQTTEGDGLLKFHSSLFEPAVANGARVHPCALRYQRADGSLCREVTYVGERTFPQSMGLVLRQRGVVATLTFAPTIETAGHRRREVAEAAHGAIASLVNLATGTEPRTTADPPAAPH